MSDETISARPWSIDNDYNVVDAKGFSVIMEHGIVFRDDADHVVRAVNCHDDLLAALKAMLKAFDYDPWSSRDSYGESREDRHARLMAGAAIRKAETGEGAPPEDEGGSYPRHREWYTDGSPPLYSEEQRQKDVELIGLIAKSMNERINEEIVEFIKEGKPPV